MKLEYYLLNDKTLKIQEDVLNTFYKFRQKSILFESGGILLGKATKDALIIEKATTPGKGDKQGVFFFHRQKRRAQTLINKAFSESKGTLIYMGEWHTHRQHIPHPSLKDKKEIIRAFKRSELNLDIIVLIVVGNADRFGNLWVGYFDGNEFICCEPVRGMPLKSNNS